MISGKLKLKKTVLPVIPAVPSFAYDWNKNGAVEQIVFSVLRLLVIVINIFQNFLHPALEELADLIKGVC